MNEMEGWGKNPFDKEPPIKFTNFKVWAIE